MQGDAVLAVREDAIPHNPSAHLMPFIQKAMEDAGERYQDFQAIAVNCGPGSFTGIRVGMAAAQALSYACGVPLYGLSGFFVLAYEARCVQDIQGPLLTLLNTRRGDYFAAYWGRGSGLERGPLWEKVMTAEQIEEFVNKADSNPAPILLAGHGVADVSMPLERVVLTASRLGRVVQLCRRISPSAFRASPYYMRPPSVYENKASSS